MAACVVFIAEGSLKSIPNLFTRPNMAFWRSISRFCCIYLLFLIFLIFQNINDARELFLFFDKSLNQKLTRSFHTYDDNCEFTYENLVDNLDHYYIIHFINWTLAAFICRDYYILFFWQFYDEIIELSF